MHCSDRTNTCLHTVLQPRRTITLSKVFDTMFSIIFLCIFSFQLHWLRLYTIALIFSFKPKIYFISSIFHFTICQMFRLMLPKV